MNLKFKITNIILIISLSLCLILNGFNFVNCRDGALVTFVEEFSARRTTRFHNLSENLHNRLGHLLNDDEEPLPPPLHARRLFNTFKPTSYSSSYFNHYTTTTIRPPWNTYNRYNNDYFNNNRRPVYTKHPNTDYPNHNYEPSTTSRPYWFRPSSTRAPKPTFNYNKPTASAVSSIRPNNIKPNYTAPAKPTTFNPKYVADCACKRGRIGSSSGYAYTNAPTTTVSTTTTTATTPSFNITSNRLNRFKENFLNFNNPPLSPNNRDMSRGMNRDMSRDMNRDINTRIVNGTVADYYKYPWSVSLGRGIDGKYTNESHYCGGSLIARQWIISAGHCLTDFMPKQLIIAYGSGDRTKMKHFAEVEQVVVHPQYSGWPHYLNDIALVKLKQPIELNASIKPACLHSNYIRLRKEFDAIGWGRLGNEADFPIQLQKTKFNYVTTDECKSRWSKEESHPDITTSNICVYNPHTDICGGDSGSALMNVAEDGVFYLVGVASFTNFCDQTQPAVYVRIYSHINWIVSVVKNFC